MPRHTNTAEPGPGRPTRQKDRIVVTLYLASTSPARLMLLRQAGVEPVVIPSEVDEDAAVARHEAEHGALSPAEMVALLGRVKAEAVVEAAAETSEALDGFVVGGDSAFEIDGVAYGKPHTPERARERWQLQRGATGTLHSGLWVIDHRGGRVNGATGGTTSATVTFADDITDDEIDDYIATGEPLQVAGAFTIDSLGAPFIQRIEGDPSTVVGMSLPALRRTVNALGGSWSSLRNR